MIQDRDDRKKNPEQPGETTSLDDPSVVGDLEAYCEALQRGESPDRSALLAKHPSVADELAECIEALDFVRELGPPLDEESNDDADDNHGLPFAATLGDYRLIRETGRGGMGVVYEAEQISLKRRVALKVLPFMAALSPRQLQRFKNEAQAAASLDHPNIVHVYAIGCERAVHYYAMQYVDGLTLAEVVQELRQFSRCGENGDAAEREPEDVSEVTRSLLSSQSGDSSPVPEGTTSTATNALADAQPQTRKITSSDAFNVEADYFRTVAKLGIQAADALQHAHELGVVHRDIKPSNLMLDTTGQLWVTDFGLAQTRAGGSLTITGDVIGTLRYMCPAQIRGERIGLDHRTDIYSLGATLYELLVLRPAFMERNRQKLIRQVVEEEPTSPRHIKRSVPRDLETIALKAMSKEPERRYESAQQLADDLNRFLTHKPIHAQRPSLAARTTKWMRRHRAISAAILAVVLTAVTSIGMERWSTYRSESRLIRDVQVNLDNARALLASRDLNNAKQELLKAQVILASESLEHLNLNEHCVAIAKEIESKAKADEQFRLLQRTKDEIYAELYYLTNDSLLRARDQAQIALERYAVFADARWDEHPLVRHLDPGAIPDLEDALAELVLVYARTTTQPHRSFDTTPRPAHKKYLSFLDWRPQMLDAQLEQQARKHAIDSLQRLESVCGESRGVLLWLADVAKLQGDESVGSDFGRRANEVKPETVFDHFAVAEYYASHGKYEEALTHYEMAIDGDPGHFPSLLAVGMILSSSGQDDAGLAALNGAIAVNSNVALPFIERGKIRRKKGKIALATRDFERVRSMRPEITRDCLAQSAYFRNRRDFLRSNELIDIRLHLNPRNWISYKWRAVNHVYMSNYDLALRDFAESLRTTPESCRMTMSFAEIYYLRCGLFLECGELDRALADCIKAVKIVPDASDFQSMLGAVYAARGESDLAIDLWLSVLKSGDIDTRVVARVNLSIEYRKRGDAEKALEHANAAIQLEPNNYTAILNRGRVHRMNGELEQAIEDLSRAIEIYPGRGGLISRAEAFFDSGEWNRAKADYDKAIELDPEEALAYVNRAAILRGKLDEPQQAMDDLSRAISLSALRKSLL